METETLHRALFLGLVGAAWFADILFSWWLRMVAPPPSHATGWWRGLWHQFWQRRFSTLGLVLPAASFLWVGPLAHSLFDVDPPTGADPATTGQHHALLVLALVPIAALQFSLARLLIARVVWHRARDGQADWPLWMRCLLGDTVRILALIGLCSLVAAFVVHAAVDGLGLLVPSPPRLGAWLAELGINLPWVASCVALMETAVVCHAVGVGLDAFSAAPDSRPRRWIAVGLATGVVIASVAFRDPERVATVPVPGANEYTASERVIAQLEVTVGAIPADRPALVIAAAGGGSRAAVFAAMVYDLLSRPRDDGSGQAPLDEVILVSAVSGGSVGSAHALAVRFWSRVPDTDERREVVPGPVANPGQFLLSSPLASAMRTNFYGPAALGVFTPRQSRALALREYWAAEFGWGERWRRFDGAARDKPRPAPLLVLNATSAPSGRRVPLSFPAVPPGWWLASGAASGDERLLAPPDVSTAIAVEDAVRMSASFPFGMSMATIDNIDDPATNEPPGPEPWHRHATDGGVLDNTGLDVLEPFFAGLQALATPGTCAGDLAAGANAASDPGCERLRARAASVVKLLCAHGVNVLEIDSGAKPTRTNWTRNLLLDSVLAWESLGRAARVRERAAASEARRESVARLSCPGGSVDAGVAYRPPGPGESQAEPVPTAWALGAADVVELAKQVSDAFATGTPGDGTVRGMLAARAAAPAQDKNPSPPSAPESIEADIDYVLGEGRVPPPSDGGKTGATRQPAGGDAAELQRFLSANHDIIRRSMLTNTEPGVYLLDELNPDARLDGAVVATRGATEGLAVGLAIPTLLVDAGQTRVLAVVAAGTPLATVPGNAPPGFATVVLDHAGFASSACLGVRVDVFACEGAPGAWDKAVATEAAIESIEWQPATDSSMVAGRPGRQRDCVRTRLISERVNRLPDYRLSDNVIRSDEDESYHEAELAEHIASLPGFAGDAAIAKGDYRSKGYLSVFVCDGARVGDK